MENILSISSNKYFFLKLLILVTLLTSGLSFGSSYEVNKATELYNNGEFKRAKSFLTGIDLSKDYVGSYMMGAISLQDDEITLKSKFDIAIYWFQISADLGFAQAYHALGRAYEQRWLNNKNSEDLNQSKSNYKLAYSKGFFQAKSDILRLEPGYEFSDKMETTVPPEIKLAEGQLNADSSITSKTSGKNHSDGLFSGFQANTVIAESYVGISLGTTTIGTGITNTTGTASLEESDSGFKLIFGKKIGESTFWEIFYADIGEAYLTGNTGDTFDIDNTTFVFTTDNARVAVAATGFGINLKSVMELNSKSSLIGRIGLHMWEAEVTVSGASVDGSDLFYGVGYKYNLNSDLAFTIDYDFYKVDDQDSDMFAIGLLTNF